MDYLWSPWRYRYVTSTPQEPSIDVASDRTSPGETCLFCRVAAQSDDRANYIVERAERNFVLLNRYPYAAGHLMIAPYEHVATLEDARRETLEELIRLSQRAEAVLRRVYRAGGLNLGFNIGECAGAGVAGHIHMHVLPRWHGDTSFITTTGETRVLPEDLETTFEKLSEALRAAS
ncbi:MAG TPA: HIT domain-containing protein [Bryobacteraceae bacterium]|nr:HIT domain-containing protein [Bryobacteraceae bacterium]